jgi:hypothetical protein
MASCYIVHFFRAGDSPRICQRTFWQIQITRDFLGLPRFVFWMPRLPAIASTNRRVVRARLLRQIACTAPLMVVCGPVASL